MLRAKGANYFPFVCLMDAEGEVLTEFRPTSEKALDAALTLAKQFVEFREKAKTDPTAAAAVEVLEAFKSKTPPPLGKLKEVLAKSGLEKTHPDVVKKGMADVAKVYFENVNKNASQQMRKVATAEDSAEKIQAIDRERCIQLLALHNQGVAFEQAGYAYGFYTGAAKGAAHKKEAKVATDLLGRAEKAYKSILSSYDRMIGGSQGQRKVVFERRRKQLVANFEAVAKAVKAIQ